MEITELHVTKPKVCRVYPKGCFPSQEIEVREDSQPSYTQELAPCMGPASSDAALASSFLLLKTAFPPNRHRNTHTHRWNSSLLHQAGNAEKTSGPLVGQDIAWGSIWGLDMIFWAHAGYQGEAEASSEGSCWESVPPPPAHGWWLFCDGDSLEARWVCGLYFLPRGRMMTVNLSVWPV